MKTDLGGQESEVEGEKFDLILRVARYQGEVFWLI